MLMPAVPTSYLLTMDGSVQNVATALGLTFTGTTIENSIAELHVQADPANGAVAEFGDADVDTAGLTIPAPVGGITPAPYVLAPHTNTQLFLSQLYVKGTAGQKLRLFVIPYNH